MIEEEGVADQLLDEDIKAPTGRRIVIGNYHHPPGAGAGSPLIASTS